MNKFLGWTAAAAFAVGGLVGCSSDKKLIVTTTTAATGSTSGGATASTAAAGSGASGATPSVDAFCKEITDYAAKVQAAIANPSGADKAALGAAAQKLSTESQALVQSNPADIAKIEACAQTLAAAYNPAP